MLKTPLKRKTKHRINHNGSALVKKLKSNAKHIVAKSLLKAKKQSAPITYFVRKNPKKTASLTLLAVILGGFCAGYFLDRR